MNIQELQDEKRLLEQELLELVTEKLEGFRNKTGVSVERVNVEMYDTTTRREAIKNQRSAIVVNINCSLAL